MARMKNFNEFIVDCQNDGVLEQYSGISSVMNKVIAYNKREMIAMGNVTNESFRSMYRYNQDIFFSIDERESIKEMFKEFIPRVANSFAVELYESGCEFDDSIYSELGIDVELNEGLKDLGKKIKGAYDSVVKASASVAHKVGGVIDDVADYVGDKAKEVKEAPEKIRKKIVEKYKSIIDFLQKIIASGAKTVKEFITSVAKLFDKIGTSLSDSLKKLGAFETESGEDKANVTIENKWLDGVTENNDEKGFIAHVVAYMSIMMSDNKEKVDKLVSEGFDNLMFNFDEDELNEGKIMDKVANNKFIQFILCYGKGKKISIWKSILISIVGSLVISFALPVILSVCGIGAATIPVCVACVRMIWSTRSCFKIILNRYVNKKEGEKLFDSKTCLMLAICILPQIPPFKDWIAEAFGKVLKWLGIDKWIEGIEEKLGKLIEKLHGNNPSEVVTEETWNECLNEGGGYQYFTNWDENNAALIQHAKDCGSGDGAMNFIKKMVNGGEEIKGSTNFHKYWNDIIDKFGGDAPAGMIVDTQKSGVNHLFSKAMRAVADTGEYPGMTGGVIGGEVWHNETHRIAGACNMLYNMPEGAKEAILDKFKELGGNIDDLKITEFGHGVVHKIIPHIDVVTKPVHWLFDTLVASFSPTFIPWLDKKKWGKFKMSFGSNTSKLPYHIVTEVKMMDLEKARKEYGENNQAFDKMIDEIKDIQTIHHGFINAGENQVEDSNDSKIKKFFKKFSNEQDKNYEKNGDLAKRQVVVFFVEHKDKESGKVEEVPGVVMDLLSMMCVDVCTFRKPRRNPYYMKGMLSRLSFKPVEKNDNDTKQYIRETLGVHAGNSVRRMYNFGIAGCLIDKDENDKFIPGSNAEKDKELSYIGNFTIDEFCEIMNDESKENSVAYSYLSGKYGSNVGLGGGKKLSLKHDKNTIENRRYVSADKPIEDDREVTVKNKEGKRVKKKYSEMKKYQADKYDMRRATPEEIESGMETMDYVEARIIPLINDKSTKLHKELYGDDDIKKLFFKDGDDEEVDKGLIMSIKDYLYRAESSFSEKDEHNACEKMNAYRKENDQDELGKDSYNTIKKAVETIWELKGKHSNAKKKPKKTQTTNESRFLSFNDFVKMNG